LNLKFAKMQGAGNDFVVVESDGLDLNWRDIALAMCDRHYGVGADGLLLLTKSNAADFGMRILNADGSEAKMCGNGIRCLVKYYVESSGLHDAKQMVSVDTPVGVRLARFERVGSAVSRVKVGMGRPEFLDEGCAGDPTNAGEFGIISEAERSVSMGQELDLTLLSIGNCHAVYFTEIPLRDFPLSEIGPALRHQRTFPRDVNFEVAHLIGSDHIEARVWEHGVGETLACGSGACAVAVAARSKGYIGNRVEISLPGGTLDVEWDGVSDIFLNGPAETVFHGVWPLPENDRIPPLMSKPTKDEVLA
jgi:diaminopimelate epimerase